MKYRFIKRYRSEHRVSKICQVSKVCRSIYYQWLKGKKSQRAYENEALLEEIKNIHSDRYKESYYKEGSLAVFPALSD